MFFFFFDEVSNLKKSQIEYHYLSQSSKFGIEKNDSGVTNFYDSSGILEKQHLTDDSQSQFQEIDFKRLISEKIRKTVYGEKYSNIVFLAGAGASVAPDLNPKYGKTVKMIAEDVYLKLHEIDDLYTLEQLAEKCKYNDGYILARDQIKAEHIPQLADNFNLEDFLSTLFHYRPYVPDNDKEKFNSTIEKILLLIKDSTFAH